MSSRDAGDEAREPAPELNSPGWGLRFDKKKAARFARAFDLGGPIPHRPSGRPKFAEIRCPPGESELFEESAVAVLDETVPLERGAPREVSFAQRAPSL